MYVVGVVVSSLSLSPECMCRERERERESEGVLASDNAFRSTSSLGEVKGDWG